MRLFWCVFIVLQSASMLMLSMSVKDGGGEGTYLPWLMLCAGVLALAITGQRAYLRMAKRISSLTKAHRQVKEMYHEAPCGYHSLDARGRVVRMNATELSWLGYEANEVVGNRQYVDFVAPEHREHFLERFGQVTDDQRVVEIECDLISFDDERRTVVIRATAKTDDDDVFVHSRATVFDITERKKMEVALERMARTDELTGLGNRHAFQELGEHEVSRHARTGSTLMLLVADLDHFKSINDTYGHEAGDEVLRHFGHCVRHELRGCDVLCRLGGEEFAFLLPDTSEEGAVIVAERLREAIGRSSVVAANHVGELVEIRYTVSCGITRVLIEENALNKAVQRADHALYEAKDSGRNKVVNSSAS